MPRRLVTAFVFVRGFPYPGETESERIMKKIAIIAISLMAVGSAAAQVSVSSPTSGNSSVQSDDKSNTADMKRIWPDFHAVEIEGPMQVCFETADAQHPVGVSYYAKDFEGSKYVCKVESGVLKLRMQRSKSVDSLRVTVRYNNLSAVKVADGSVRFDGLLKAHLLDVKVSGGAAFEATVDAADLQLEVTGHSRVILSGSSRYMDAVVSTASVDASQLRSTAVTVDASNKAVVTVQAAERVVMKSTTGAMVRYAGNPAIERSRTSSLLSGSFERLNSEK